MRGLDLVPQYLYYIGTDKKTSAEINKEFYKLACSYSIDVNDDQMTISLSGLSENMPQALRLLEDFLQNAKADRESYDNCVSLLEKTRNDAKTDQKSCFMALQDYAKYGEYNPVTNTLSIDELRNADPQALPDMLKGLNGMKHQVLYFGPYSQKELLALLAKEHKTQKKLADVPQGKPYTLQTITTNTNLIAPYDAKNIYMAEFSNTGKQWNIDETAKMQLFNEYFGGGMNSIVFQELREARGLCYSSGAYYYMPSKKGNPETFRTFIITQNDKMMDCINTFREIIDTIPQAEGAFNIAKQNLKKSIESLRVTRAGVLKNYLNMQRLGVEENLTRKVYEQLPSLTMKDIVDYEKANVVGKPRTRIVLGNEDELDIKSLEKTGEVRRLTSKDIFGY